MLEEYKELCRQTADSIDGWRDLTKNELCIAYVKNRGNEDIQNAYLGAILYRYWNLIPKYHYLSSSCATPEDCYEWLVDSVLCCVNLAVWENPKSSIYNDPNGPDKVINRCMKCARLTYYQFVNRKKRRDNFGLLSIEDLQEEFGSSTFEPKDDSQDIDITAVFIKDFIITKFRSKDYFIAFLLDCIISKDVFDLMRLEKDSYQELNVRKLCRTINSLDESYVKEFSLTYDISEEDVSKGFRYLKMVPQAAMRKKVIESMSALKHSQLGNMLNEGRS